MFDEIDRVSKLLSIIEEIEEIEKRKAEKPLRHYRPLRYYRGQSDANYKLNPSVMRNKNRRRHEGEMLRDLMTRRPDEFSRYASALDRWMCAQHHDLCSRFIDISTNPLVGLFFACDDSKKDDTDGDLYVFATTRDRVKPYDSDSVSIVANFARLRRDEQKAILKKTKEFLSDRGAFVDQRRRIMRRTDRKDVDEIRRYAGYMESRRRENEASGRYSDMGRLWTFIKQEKPYFVEGLIDPRDLFRIFVVQPRLLFPRVIAQSGAFLVSAYHKTFDVQCGPDDCDLPYNCYRLTVKAKSKCSIRKELQSLNISRETLFPELDKAAQAILKDTDDEEHTHVQGPGGNTWIST